MMIVNYIAAVLLIVMGLYTVMFKKELIKIVVGLGIIDYGINLFIVSIGFNDGGTRPSVHRFRASQRCILCSTPVPRH